MTEEQPGYAERDDDEFSEPTGGGAEVEELDDDALAGLADEDLDGTPDQGADWDDPDDAA